MDYNSQPWTYEVIGYMHSGTLTRDIFTDGTCAKVMYETMNINKDVYRTVLLTQSRKGVVKGQYEI